MSNERLCSCGSIAKTGKKCKKCYAESKTLDCTICGRGVFYKRPDQIKVAPMCSDCFSDLPVSKEGSRNYLYRCRDCSKYFRGSSKICPLCAGNRNKIGAINRSYTCRDCGEIIVSKAVNPKCNHCGGNNRIYRIPCKKCNKIHIARNPVHSICIKCSTISEEARKPASIRILEEIAGSNYTTSRVKGTIIIELPGIKKGKYPRKCVRCDRGFSSDHKGSNFWCGACYPVLSCPICTRAYSTRSLNHPETCSPSCQTALQHRRGSFTYGSTSINSAMKELAVIIEDTDLKKYNPQADDEITAENVGEYAGVAGIWCKYGINTEEVLDVMLTCDIEKEYRVIGSRISNPAGKYIDMCEYDSDIALYFIQEYENRAEGLVKEAIFAIVNESKYWHPEPGQAAVLKKFLESNKSNIAEVIENEYYRDKMGGFESR